MNILHKRAKAQRLRFYEEMEIFSFLGIVDFSVSLNRGTKNLDLATLFFLHFNHIGVSPPFSAIATMVELPWRSLC